MPSLEVLEVRLGIHRMTAFEPFDLGRGQLQRDLSRHPLREPALQIEHVFELPVVALRPEGFVRARGDELDAQPHAVAGELG